MKVVCFGDSNTWGYDPRDFFGGPYDTIWPELLERKTGWEVSNRGENGREIPSGNIYLSEDTDFLIVMLGTNDLLQGREPSNICRSMEIFLRDLPISRNKILLVSPPHMRHGTWVTDPRLTQLSAQMTECFRALALPLGIFFADADRWNIPIAYDGIHFTEEGHRIFSEEIIQYLTKELDICCKPD